MGSVGGGGEGGVVGGGGRRREKEGEGGSWRELERRASMGKIRAKQGFGDARVEKKCKVEKIVIG